MNRYITCLQKVDLTAITPEKKSFSKVKLSKKREGNAGDISTGRSVQVQPSARLLIKKESPENYTFDSLNQKTNGYLVKP